MGLDNLSNEKLIYEFFLFVFSKTVIHLYKDIVYDDIIDYNKIYPRKISESTYNKLFDEVRSMYYFSIWLTYWILNHKDYIKKYKSRKASDKNKEYRSWPFPFYKVDKIIHDNFRSKENLSDYDKIFNLINKRYKIDWNIPKWSISELLTRGFYEEDFKSTYINKEWQDILINAIKTKIALLFDDTVFDDLYNFSDFSKEQLSLPIDFYRKIIINFLSNMFETFSKDVITKKSFYKEFLGFDDFDIMLYSDSCKWEYIYAIWKYLDFLLSNKEFNKFIMKSQRLTIRKAKNK